MTRVGEPRSARPRWFGAPLSVSRSLKRFAGAGGLMIGRRLADAGSSIYICLDLFFEPAQNFRFCWRNLAEPIAELGEEVRGKLRPMFPLMAFP